MVSVRSERDQLKTEGQDIHGKDAHKNKGEIDRDTQHSSDPREGEKKRGGTL